MFLDRLEVSNNPLAERRVQEEKIVMGGQIHQYLMIRAF
jgi:hypothetical protein